jgi:hypothetical protein
MNFFDIIGLIFLVIFLIGCFLAVALHDDID